MYNNIIGKLRTAGVKMCPTHGELGAGQLETQLHRTAGDHINSRCTHISLHVSAQ
jgi:hypothetical protein